MAQNTQPSKKDVQQTLYLFQVFENQQKVIIEQLNMLETQIQGIRLSKKTIKGLENAKENQEIMIPVGSNAFIKAKLSDTDNVAVTISNNILLEKPIVDGIKSMDKLMNNYNEIKKRLNKQLSEINSKLAQIKPIVDQIYQSSGIQNYQ